MVCLMRWCFCVVVLLFSPFLPLSCIFSCITFWIQAFSHRLTFSFPSTNDSCVFLLVLLRWSVLPFWYIFSSLNFSTLFVFLIRTLQLVLRSRFSTLVVEWCTWRAQVTILICCHPHRMPFSNLQELIHFCVFMWVLFVKLNFECL